MFVAVINRAGITERVFASINKKICENWATEEAKKIFGKNQVDYIGVDDTFTHISSDVSVSVLESERFS